MKYGMSEQDFVKLLFDGGGRYVYTWSAQYDLSQ